MANVQHNSLITENVHVPGYVQASDPGAVGAGKLWTDTSGGAGSWVTKMRNLTNTDWEVVGISGYSGIQGASGYSGADGALGTSGFSGYSGFSGNNPGSSGYSGWSGYSGFAGVSTYVRQFANGDLTPPGILTIVHNLGTKYNVVQVYDDADQLIIPTSITQNDVNTCTLDITAYSPISSNWNVVVISGG